MPPKFKLTPEGRSFGLEMRNTFGWVPGSPPGTIPDSELQKHFILSAIDNATFIKLGVTETDIDKAIKSLTQQLTKGRPRDAELGRKLFNRSLQRRVLINLFEEGLITSVEGDHSELEDKFSKILDRTEGF